MIANEPKARSRSKGSRHSDESGDYDCLKGLFKDDIPWTSDKVDWCCTFHHLGCSKEVVEDTANARRKERRSGGDEAAGGGEGHDLFNCLAGLEDAAWTFEKATWCCEKKQLGCGKVTAVQAKFKQVSSRSDWTLPAFSTWFFLLAFGATSSLVWAGIRWLADWFLRGRGRRRASTSSGEDLLSSRSLIGFSSLE